ncbi:aldehyde dehydrogenase family protein [Duganella sp. BJB488]|uniref:aldehyde dehydrogenase family protein n=1 Tax=unclassified Duganella TaxID=2636909 RepID=UPI000E346298|nr:MULTISPECIES: aldehyde dehydrogenase family protein [unclassified Duganella]RFP15368.1 aldehyde dehydrogenase family protein [Duganella sp. BJB489]RFP19925.1 aldehyde dehydrogenase family protein [Duganella sp. BJB488]RFP38313.1 aldehyde dehydrogenase family protein [Duganella sp. BJB480]
MGEADAGQIKAAFDAQLATALRWRTSNAAERIARVKRLRDALMAQREAFYAAFESDYRKSPAEVEATEFLPVMEEIRQVLGALKRWMKPRRRWPTTTMLGTYATVRYQPRGRVLIIAPWNYPLSLCFGPLVSALAAGNTALIKPSEMTPAVSALMARIIADVFRADEVALFEGGQPTSHALLQLPFDHIFFTGSPAVGKLVMAAAAQHLASVTLELGGKSPTIVDQTANLQLAAETLMWGKFLNNGQTCVAPDHVYVHASVKAGFLAACRQVLQQRYGADAAAQRQNRDLTRVVNQRHTRRLATLLSDAVQRGAVVHTGGEVDEAQCYIAPTLIEQIPAGAAILSEEIFGPLLPIIEYRELDQVIAAINAAPKPLALYVWSTRQANIDQVLQQTSSGGACVNHCVAHFAHGNLPFGGVNNSGVGSAHGEYGFKAFSHERAVLRASPLMLIKLFFPPYTRGRLRLIRLVVDSLRLPML